MPPPPTTRAAAPAGPAGLAPSAARAASTRSPAVLVAVVVAVGALDFGLAIRPIVSTILTVILSLTALPWIVMVLGRGPVTGATDLRATVRRLVFHVANVLLVLAFFGAKWLVLIDALAAPAHLVGSYRNYTAALVVMLVLGIALRGGRVAQLVAASAQHPARLMAASFGLTSLLGALLLALPMSLRNVEQMSLLDSLFMSVSAVCVTGLTTVNVADTYTLAGQIVLCALMQIGGLGIMVLTAAVTMLAGRRLGVKDSAALAEMVDATSLADLRRMVSTIVTYTLLFEAAGAALLYWQLDALPGADFRVGAEGGLGGAESAQWAAVFHSVSAFCNGSLSNFHGGLVPFADSPLFCQTISLLILLGGMGFPVIHEVIFRGVDRLRGRRPPRLTLNTRVAATSGAALLVGVALATLALENGASFKHLGVVDRVSAALFHSACARTSGFNVVDIATMRPATLLLTCFAMFIGAGPGSTAGGIKTTTFAVLFAAFRGELRGQKPRLFDRTVPEAVVRRAIGVAFLSTSIVAVVVFLLVLFEPQDPLALTFEAVSAFSTTGLSTGITPNLNVAGKLLLALTMLIGRIGPLTAALALSARARRTGHELAQERVMIG